ncbi:MAG: hypothetical protein ACK578_09035 [Pirellula sp.]|jgi:hypothetical protein
MQDVVQRTLTDEMTIDKCQRRFFRGNLAAEVVCSGPGCFGAASAVAHVVDLAFGKH